MAVKRLLQYYHQLQDWEQDAFVAILVGELVAQKAKSKVTILQPTPASQ